MSRIRAFLKRVTQGWPVGSYLRDLADVLSAETIDRAYAAWSLTRARQHNHEDLAFEIAAKAVIPAMSEIRKAGGYWATASPVFLAFVLAALFEIHDSAPSDETFADDSRPV